jgi:hypothetical protein
MIYVYLIQSQSLPNQRSVGLTPDLKKHAKATAFELYLKSGSGHAFVRRHLW